MSMHFFQPSAQSFIVKGIGELSLRPFKLEHDIAQIHHWVTQPYAHFWGMQGFDRHQVIAEYQRLCQHSHIFIGEYRGKDTFLLEVYNPHNEALAEHYAVQRGDCGMHILVAPADQRIRGFTWGIFQTVMQFLFSDPAIHRVVVEPDVGNQKIHALNTRAGFAYQKRIQLANKTAHLAFCTRQQFFHALNKPIQSTEDAHSMGSQALNSPQKLENPQQVTKHLNPDIWQHVNRLLLRKTLSECCHERLLKPIFIADSEGYKDCEVHSDGKDIVYRFRTRLQALNHWNIDTDSIKKYKNEKQQALDAVEFFIEFQQQLTISDELLPTYLEEICSTLYGSAFKHQRGGMDVTDLISADFQTVEAAMMEGHPCFIANNGRIGFTANDYQAFAPETGQAIQYIWLAVSKKHTVFSTVESLDYETLINEELDAATRQQFNSALSEKTEQPQNYYYLPVHPWQWYQKLVTLFAPDLATRDIICLGYGPDHYQAQQSIRTLFNRSHPNKRYIKTSLSILNMGFMRGLSPYYMSSTPAINDWIDQLIKQDPYLAKTGFSILREVAAIGYRNPRFEQATHKNSAHRKMLSALWRESPLPALKKNQRLMTMAALLHVDKQGVALLPALIADSGIKPEEWMATYLQSYLTPLLHCFYAYDLVFMPHGENIILVMENNLPLRAIMKDIAEECAIMNEDVLLSDKVQRLAVSVPEDLKILSLLTDIFDCFFRFLSTILDDHGMLSEVQFWQQVAHCVHRYQGDHPELLEKFQRYDLFAEEFTLSCLNRLQLSNNKQMIDLADPAKNLKFEGTLKNPIAPYRSANSEQLHAASEMS
ncbi:MAG: GNAT family N-acetyltransferase [Cellvibrionaceae bacterium]|nr:GNAT family N-acetyltransferase [Cellvibrionaceae bacterium]